MSNFELEDILTLCGSAYQLAGCYTDADGTAINRKIHSYRLKMSKAEKNGLDLLRCVCPEKINEFTLLTHEASLELMEIIGDTMLELKSLISILEKEYDKTSKGACHENL